MVMYSPMPIDQIILLLILGAAVVLYATRWIPHEVTSVLTIAGIALAGLLPARDALAGFSSTATLTVGAMFVLSTGLVRTGALETVTLYLSRFSRGSRRRLLLLLGGTVPLASAFMNNTPIVVMMVPVILSLSPQVNARPSKLLMPISHFALLGGTITVIGTSTNILLDDLYRQAGGPGFGFFEFAPMGLIFTAIGIVYVVFFSRRLLPNRAPLADLVTNRQDSTYISEITLDAASRLVGKQADQAFEQIARLERADLPRRVHRHRRLRRATPSARTATNAHNSIELLEIVRDGRIYRADETIKMRLMADDTLMVAGAPKEIALFLNATGARLATVLEDNERVSAQDMQQRVIEAVVLPDSRYIGRVVSELGLYRLNGIKVLGIQRHGRQQLSGLRTMRLQSGDVLLLQAPPEGLRTASEAGNLLIVEGVESSILRPSKNRLALLIMAIVILLATFSSIPIVFLALAGAGVMVMSQCLRLDEAIQSLDANTLLLLAATIPLGAAIQSTGLAQVVVDLLLSWVGNAQPVVILSAIYLTVNLLTQVLSNQAAVVLFTPIALSLATRLGLNPTPFLMAVVFAANASLLSPIGHPVNTIVMGPGGYEFVDYVRAGLPLLILLWLAATFCIPLIWPF